VSGTTTRTAAGSSPIAVARPGLDQDRAGLQRRRQQQLLAVAGLDHDRGALPRPLGHRRPELLCMDGFPVPVGGSGQLSAALARRAGAAGAELRTGERVDRIEVRGGRAVAVHTATGRTGPWTGRSRGGPRRWPAPAPCTWVPMSSGWSGGRPTSSPVPRAPFLLFGQMAVADPTRAPEGAESAESAWADTHLPRGVADDASAEELADRIEQVVEQFAPGFGDLVLHKYLQRPSDLESADPNLAHGTANGGTAQLFQQLVFRPVPGLGRPSTPVAGLYLGSAAAHPGGGVHGICGWLAARSALRDQGLTGAVRRRLLAGALAAVQ
jgi:phytoene dehydrogenase-like protein